MDKSIPALSDTSISDVAIDAPLDRAMPPPLPAHVGNGRESTAAVSAEADETFQPDLEETVAVAPTPTPVQPAAIRSSKSDDYRSCPGDASDESFGSKNKGNNHSEN